MWNIRIRFEFWGFILPILIYRHSIHQVQIDIWSGLINWLCSNQENIYRFIMTQNALNNCDFYPFLSRNQNERKKISIFFSQSIVNLIITSCSLIMSCAEIDCVQNMTINSWGFLVEHSKVLHYWYTQMWSDEELLNKRNCTWNDTNRRVGDYGRIVLKVSVSCLVYWFDIHIDGLDGKQIVFVNGLIEYCCLILWKCVRF